MWGTHFIFIGFGHPLSLSSSHTSSHTHTHENSPLPLQRHNNLHANSRRDVRVSSAQVGKETNGKCHRRIPDQVELRDTDYNSLLRLPLRAIIRASGSTSFGAVLETVGAMSTIFILSRNLRPVSIDWSLR
jgi:hypothetical protein